MYHFHLKENYVSYVLRYGGGVSITLQKMFMRKFNISCVGTYFRKIKRIKYL